jgi:endonuclease-3
MILWENIGYLIDDARRAALFDDFAATIGLDPHPIATADDDSLLPLARRGGMRPETRVERWRTIARITIDVCGGDLDGFLRTMPTPKARALLKRFPVIGDPGADRILLFAGLATRPTLDSNGLRVLARLGFFPERTSYAASYREAIDVLDAAGAGDRDWLIDAFVHLRALGQSACRRGAPMCQACPLDAVCEHMAVERL